MGPAGPRQRVSDVMGDDSERTAVLLAIGEMRGALGELKGVCAGTACQTQHIGEQLDEGLKRLGKLENRVTKLEESVRHWRPISLATSAASGLGGGGIISALVKLLT